MIFIISIFQFHCKSEHKQVKWNKIKRDTCKFHSIFPYLQSSTLSKWLEIYLLIKLISKMNDDITTKNTREYGFSLTRILPYKDKIIDFVLILENTGQWKAVFPHILCSDRFGGNMILLSLYRRIRVSEKPYSRIFYAVTGSEETWSLSNFIPGK